MQLTANLASKLFGEMTQSCVLCGNSCSNNICLCNACLQELPIIEHGCKTCGLPMQIENTQCGQCISNTPPISHCISLMSYVPPIDHLIQNMKYHNQLAIADLLGQLLADKIIKADLPLPEQIIPIPLHISRLQRRGFNQSVEIARPLSKKLNIPLNLTDCSRVRATSPQFNLSIQERAGNMQNAFEVLRSLNVKHVAIIDDVMTTGSTVWEFARVLKKAGIETIDVWTCARATIN